MNKTCKFIGGGYTAPEVSVYEMPAEGGFSLSNLGHGAEDVNPRDDYDW